MNPTHPDEAAEPRVTQSLVLDPENEKRATLRRFRLSLIAGKSSAPTFTSTAERTVIGKESGADLVLEDETVSRFHCEIVLQRDRFSVRDLESRNGTVLNGVSIIEAYLTSGASLRLGNSELRFELGNERASVEVAERDSFGRVAGRSLAMRRVIASLERAAKTDVTVLLTGETGTGKELAAESIHSEGPRAEGPFIVVDCGAVPSELLESELFGHEKGAFTGAATARTGAFEAADGGTIFLDEIGELAPELQPKLLRVLERREIKPLGQTRFKPIDVRVIAATNRCLRSEVNAKRFRPDLFYRLAVVEIDLPPLRERTEDIPMLVERLTEAFGSRYEAVPRLVSPAFLLELERHSWPGNVRELRNFLERCLTMGEFALPTTTEASHSSELPDFDVPLPVARERWGRVLERKYVAHVLAKNEGNVSRAARAAGVDRMYFYRLLWRHDLR